MRHSTGLVVLIGLLSISSPNNGSAQSPEATVLFQNVRVLDGKSSVCRRRQTFWCGVTESKR